MHRYQERLRQSVSLCALRYR
uniref:Uncharacterized protein n=1 Tax=Anguilla anguilla TaxID=7936 RepID=A0A0E9P7S6_ANGAN